VTRNRMGPATVAQLRVAVALPSMVEGYRGRIGPERTATRCELWTGAVAGRGHGRYWIGRGSVVIAHRFGFAVAHGVDALLALPTLEHECDACTGPRPTRAADRATGLRPRP
jgi:hypothetical protein